MILTRLPTANLHGYNLQFWTNYSTDYLACVASVNYGLSGSGQLLIFHKDHGKYMLINKFRWTDAMLDVTWNPISENLIASSSGDGKIQVWSMTHQEEPLLIINGHSKEVSSVDWNGLGGDDNLLLSSSWDETVRVWNTVTGHQLCLFQGHNSLVYEAAWSPHMHGILASVGGDKSICLWDIRAPELLPQQIPAHSSDVLSLDWNIGLEHVIATGSVDRMIRVWDLRQPNAPIVQLAGHEAAVRRVRFSPFHKNVLASSSYDFTTRFWNWMSTDVIHLCCEHTEFVYGLDFCPSDANMVADCSWDGTIHIYENVDFNCE